MKVFSKKAFAFPNPDSMGGADNEFLLRAQDFKDGLPDKLREDPYFKLCLADGDIIIMDSAEQIDEALKSGTAGKRNGNGGGSKKSPEESGILDGGNAK